MSVTTDYRAGTGLERIRFFPRQLISADDLNQEQAYHRAKLREHNRFLHGWGVVCGCDVQAAPEKDKPWQVRICPGYVLTPQGDSIWIRSEALFDLATCFLQSSDPCAFARPCPPVTRRVLTANTAYLAVRYTECSSRPVRVAPVGCSCDEAECEYSRVVDAYELCVLAELPATHNGTGYDCGKLREQNTIVPCPDRPDDPWVVIATIKLPTSATASVTDVDPFADRRILYSTAAVQELALCADVAPTPTPTPTTPTPAPSEPLAIGGLRFFMRRSRQPVEATLGEPLVLSSSDRPFRFELEFANAVPDSETVILGRTVFVTGPGEERSVDGDLSWKSETLLYFEAADDFDPGEYRIVVRGEEPAVRAFARADMPAHDLDGDVGQEWPTGDGTPGGSFTFDFQVSEEA